MLLGNLHCPPERTFITQILVGKTSDSKSMIILKQVITTNNKGGSNKLITLWALPRLLARTASHWFNSRTFMTGAELRVIITMVETIPTSMVLKGVRAKERPLLVLGRGCHLARGSIVTWLPQRLSRRRQRCKWLKSLENLYRHPETRRVQPRTVTMAVSQGPRR